MSSIASLAIRPDEAKASDSTAKLQSLIDAAQADAGILTLDAGAYDVTGLKISASLVLKGVPGRTILKSATGGTILKIESASDVVISGIVFDSQNLQIQSAVDPVGEYQLQVFQCADILVEQCIFRNAIGSGAGFDACTGRIVGNQFYDLGQIALRTGRIEGAYKPREFARQTASHRGMEISGNHIHEVGNGGIYVFHSGGTSEEDGAIVTNNRIEAILSGSGNGQFGNGIDVFAANNVIVANNRISGCDYGGVRVVSSKHCQVIGNNISRIADCAIFVEFAFESVVVQGNVVEDVNLGIQVSGGEGVLGYLAVCSDNIVRNVNRVGINPQASNFIGIDIVSVATNCIGNVVENVGPNNHGPGIGILVMDWSSSHYHQIQSNMIKDADCGIGLVLGFGARKISVVGNTIVGASSAHITVLEQTTYADGTANTLKPVGTDLAVENEQQSTVFLSNNVTLD